MTGVRPPAGLLALLAFCTAAWSGELTAQDVLRATEGPGPRYGHELVFDEARGLTVLFGGFRPDGTPLADTWGWDGDSWQLLARIGPPARRWPAAAYDAQREVVVLFGGRAGVGRAGGRHDDRLLTDLWRWDASGWSRQPGEGPVRRGIYASAYDPIRGKLLFHGSGRLVHGEWRLERSTWTWSDDSGWVQAAPHTEQLRGIEERPGRPSQLIRPSRHPVIQT